MSDSKSPRFRLDKSYLKEPKRLARLLLAVCLAYLWIVYRGTVSVVEGWSKLVHRTELIDLSLVNLVLNPLEFFLNEQMPIPAAFIPLDLDEF